jgi:cytochrome o ubiquinol oxidase subunit 2
VGTKAVYAPDSKQRILLQLAWWVVPAVVIFSLAFLTLKSTHALDPYKPIATDTRPLTIQVIALQWKWLFIYPEHNIATVNFIQFPASTPVNFELTADAPMNSFWIPQLGGQIYAMTGMSTKLHLIADKVGDFDGSSAEISGRGFSGMRFTARASSPEDFDLWVREIKEYGKELNRLQYEKLARPSENTPPGYFAPVEDGLYNRIVNKFMPTENGQMNH